MCALFGMLPAHRRQVRANYRQHEKTVFVLGLEETMHSLLRQGARRVPSLVAVVEEVRVPLV